MGEMKEETRRERLKSALYLRLKYRKTIFGKKLLQFFFRKRSHSAKKIETGTVVLSGFVSFVRTLRKKFALARLGLSGFRNFSEKWTDQCEVCGLKKKRSLIVGHFSLKGKRAD